MSLNDDVNSLELIETLNSRALSAPLPDLEIQHTWFRAVKARDWTSLALVPADPNIKLLPIARGLGQMATQEPGARVLVVNARTLDCAPDAPADAEAAVLTDPEYGYDLMDFSTLPINKAQQALALLPQLLDKVMNAAEPYSTVVVAVDPVRTHTRALPAARTADRVILCLPLGTTSFSHANELVQLIGRDRLLGCITIRPA